MDNEQTVRASTVFQQVQDLSALATAIPPLKMYDTVHALLAKAIEDRVRFGLAVLETE